MTTINIKDDRPQVMLVHGLPRNVATVSMRCVQCGWTEKALRKKALTVAATHLERMHGGYGKIQHLGNFRFRYVENGRVLPFELGNLTDEDD